MLRNFLFRDGDSGEEFICEAETLAEAEGILEDYFIVENLTYVCELSDYEAEMSGLDTY